MDAAREHSLAMEDAAYGAFAMYTEPVLEAVAAMPSSPPEPPMSVFGDFISAYGPLRDACAANGSEMVVQAEFGG